MILQTPLRRISLLHATPYRSVAPPIQTPHLQAPLEAAQRARRQPGLTPEQCRLERHRREPAEGG